MKINNLSIKINFIFTIQKNFVPLQMKTNNQKSC